MSEQAPQCAADDPALRDGAGLPRLLPPQFTGRPVSLAGHQHRYGPLPPAGPELIEETSRAGLTGRGGAAFPTARKLDAVARASGGQAVVVVNGTEGEPASAKDKVLLVTSPHLVIDGAVAAAGAVGAGEIVIAAHPAVADVVAAAVRERAGVRLREPDIRVVPAAPGFVAGEASAVAHWVATGQPRPTGVPPHLAQRGLRNRPTLLSNAETFAHLALIARHGAPWFRSAGTPAEPGTMLVTLAGAVRQPGVREVAIGEPLPAVLAAGGGPSKPLSAVLVGGYFGTWIRWPAAADLALSAAGLAPARATPSAGLVAALPADACGLAEVARVARYLAGESAGQCGPCVFGLADIAADIGRIAAGRAGETVRLHRWLNQVEGRGACRHPDGTARFIRSGLAAFGDEIELHRRGWCSGSGGPGVLPVPERSRP